MMLVGRKHAVVTQVLPAPVRGRMLVRIQYILDEMPGRPMAAQLEEDDVCPGLYPGDPVAIEFDSGKAIQFMKIED